MDARAIDVIEPEPQAETPPVVLVHPWQEAAVKAQIDKGWHTWDEIAQRTDLWVSLLYAAMVRTGKGYRRHSLRRTGKGEDRREDKLEGKKRGIPQKLRRYTDRYDTPPYKRTPRQMRRARAAIMRGAK